MRMTNHWRCTPLLHWRRTGRLIESEESRVPLNVTHLTMLHSAGRCNCQPRTRASTRACSRSLAAPKPAPLPDGRCDLVKVHLQVVGHLLGQPRTGTFMTPSQSIPTCWTSTWHLFKKEALVGGFDQAHYCSSAFSTRFGSKVEEAIQGRWRWKISRTPKNES